MVFERYRNEFLRSYLIEPVREGPIGAAEGILVVFQSFLIFLMVVRRCDSGDVLEMGQWVHTVALARLYCGHGSALMGLCCLIPERDDVKLCFLIVQEVLLLPLHLDIRRLGGLIGLVGLDLHLGL